MIALSDSWLGEKGGERPGRSRELSQLTNRSIESHSYRSSIEKEGGILGLFFWAFVVVFYLVPWPES